MCEVELVTGRVEPATLGPHVEQVGWGVARQVARVLGERVGPAALLEELPVRAEAPGWAAYAVFAGRAAVAVALVHLVAPRSTYAGELVVDDAPAGTHEALLVRALHDAGAAGAVTLRVPRPATDLAAWPQANAR